MKPWKDQVTIAIVATAEGQTSNDPPMIADICAQAPGTLLAEVRYTSSFFGKRITCGETAAWYANPCNDYSQGGQLTADDVLAAFATGKDGCCKGDPTTAAPTVPAVPSVPPQGGDPTTAVPTVPSDPSALPQGGDPTPSVPTVPSVPASTAVPEAGDPTPSVPTVPSVSASTSVPEAGDAPSTAAPTPKPTMPAATPTPAPVVT